MEIECPVRVEIILCNRTYTFRVCPGELWRAFSLAASKRRRIEVQKLNFTLRKKASFLPP